MIISQWPMITHVKDSLETRSSTSGPNAGGGISAMLDCGARFLTGPKLKSDGSLIVWAKC